MEYFDVITPWFLEPYIDTIAFKAYAFLMMMFGVVLVISVGGLIGEAFGWLIGLIGEGVGWLIYYLIVKPFLMLYKFLKKIINV